MDRRALVPINLPTVWLARRPSVSDRGSIHASKRSTSASRFVAPATFIPAVAMPGQTAPLHLPAEPRTRTTGADRRTTPVCSSYSAAKTASNCLSHTV